jgi:hypothetical protein
VDLAAGSLPVVAVLLFAPGLEFAEVSGFVLLFWFKSLLIIQPFDLLISA